MVSILLTGHGKVSSGIFETLKMLFGVNENIKYIDFIEEETSENLKIKIKNQIDEFLENTDGVICLTDIKGGTPFKICSEISLELSGKVSVISGTNVPMLMMLASEMEDISLIEAVEIALKTGKSEIEEFKLVMRNSNNDDLEDGI
ncbi:hypothetical protein [Oceanivirga salmonicida]|uniref:PTS sugar transporter subunit IIA domain-containing protein n=1 Tax=Oceanivirga salmonicida TaxID=1769291 RepID=UPI000830D394|nr:hypothetical protein [Oceanivirga salmonicida]